MVSRLDSTCWLGYRPTVCIGTLQVVTALFCASEILHVRGYCSSCIIRAPGLFQAKLVARSKQLVSAILPLNLTHRSPLYPLPLRYCGVLRRIQALDNI